MKIGWILTSGIEEGNSSRFIAGNVLEWLSNQGVHSRIIYANPGDGSADVHWTPQLEYTLSKEHYTHVVFQKVCLTDAGKAIKFAKQNGIKTIYTVDDYLHPYDEEMIREADICVANSIFMQDFVANVHKKTAIQIPAACDADRSMYKRDYISHNFTAYWYGTLGNAKQGAEFREIMQYLGVNYEIIGPSFLKGQLVTIEWRYNFYQDLVNADIVVLPCMHEFSINEMAKGEARPVQSMILGIPTIVSPLPSYSNLITNGVDGFVCFMNTVDEIKEYIDYLRDQGNREAIGRAARERVVDAYSIETIATRWLNEVFK